MRTVFPVAPAVMEMGAVPAVGVVYGPYPRRTRKLRSGHLKGGAGGVPYTEIHVERKSELETPPRAVDTF